MKCMYQKNQVNTYLWPEKGPLKSSPPIIRIKNFLVIVYELSYIAWFFVTFFPSSPLLKFLQLLVEVCNNFSYNLKVSPILLAAQFGHVEIIGLLLNWRADVTFRSADGKNALDFAIDHNQKDCVLALIKHSSWKHSLRNSVINPVNGKN